MLGWRAAGARAVLRRLGAAAVEQQEARVFAASYSSSAAKAPSGLGVCLFVPTLHFVAVLI
jgi:large subunit ribosomal protein L22